MSIDRLSGNGNIDNLFADSASPFAAAGKDLGQEDFLTLLVTQMQHQDPLNPMEGTEFTAQLAQYSSLEQLVNVNTKLTAINESQGQNGRTQALDYIGKDIVARGDQLSLGADSDATGGFSTDQDADCIIRIMDASGSVIDEMHLGNRMAGDHTFQWDGKTLNGGKASPGAYYFEVQAVNAAGDAVEATARISGQVTRVNLEGPEPMLFVGDIPLAISEITNIQIPNNKP